MRSKLLLLALCLCALGVMLGQYEPALVGMPQLGVTFTGTLAFESCHFIADSLILDTGYKLNFTRSPDFPAVSAESPDGLLRVLFICHDKDTSAGRITPQLDGAAFQGTLR